MSLRSFYRDDVIEESIVASLKKQEIDFEKKGTLLLIEQEEQNKVLVYMPITVVPDEVTTKDTISNAIKEAKSKEDTKEIEILFTLHVGGNHFIPASITIGKDKTIVVSMSDTITDRQWDTGEFAAIKAKIEGGINEVYPDAKAEFIFDKSLKGTWEDNSCGPTAVDAVLTRIDGKPLTDLKARIDKDGKKEYNVKARKEHLDLLRSHEELVGKESKGLKYLTEGEEIFEQKPGETTFTSSGKRTPAPYTKEDIEKLDKIDDKSVSKKATEDAADEMKKQLDDGEDDLHKKAKELEEKKISTPEEQDEATKKLEEENGIKITDTTKELAKKYAAAKEKNLKLSRDFKDNIYNKLIEIAKSTSKSEDKIKEIDELEKAFNDRKDKEDKEKKISPFNKEEKGMADLLLNVVKSVLSDDKLKEEEKKEFLKKFSKEFPAFKSKGKPQLGTPDKIGDVASKLNNLVEHYQKTGSPAERLIVEHIATASSNSDLLKPLNDVIEEIVKSNGAANAKNLSKYGSQGFALFLLIGTALGAPYMLPIALVGSIAIVKAGEMFSNKFGKDPDREKTIEEIKQQREERKKIDDVKKQKQQQEAALKKEQEEEEKLNKPLLEEKSKLKAEVKKLELEKDELIYAPKPQTEKDTQRDTQRIAEIEKEIKEKTERISKLEEEIKAPKVKPDIKNNSDIKDETPPKNSELENLKTELTSLDQLIKTTDPELKLSGKNLEKAADRYATLEQQIKELEKPAKVTALESQLKELDKQSKAEGLAEEDKTKIGEQVTQLTAELEKLKTPASAENLEKEKKAIKDSIVEKASMGAALGAMEKDKKDLTKDDPKLAEEIQIKEIAEGQKDIKVPDIGANAKIPEKTPIDFAKPRHYSATMSKAERKSFVDDVTTKRAQDDSVLGQKGIKTH